MIKYSICLMVIGLCITAYGLGILQVNWGRNYVAVALVLPGTD